MKYQLFLLVFFCLSCQKENVNSFIKVKHVASKIDSLNTATEIEEFLYSIDTNARNLRLKRISETSTFHSPTLDSINHINAKKLKVDKPFYKTDFDNNGYTDLLIIGGWDRSVYDSSNNSFSFEPIVIMNYGFKKSEIVPLRKNYHSIFVPQIKETDSLPILVLHQPNRVSPENPKIDTTQISLINYNGMFIEYNKAPVQKYNIEKIEFAAGPCFGTCPMFELMITNDRQAWFIAQHYNFSKEHRDFNDEEGTYRTIIKQDEYNKIINLINNINFTQLKDDYSVMHTDAPSAKLIVTYNNGKVKQIRDYGKSGTYGLKALYKIFEELRFNQDWKPAKEPEGIRINSF